MLLNHPVTPAYKKWAHILFHKSYYTDLFKETIHLLLESMSFILSFVAVIVVIICSCHSFSLTFVPQSRKLHFGFFLGLLTNFSPHIVFFGGGGNYFDLKLSFSNFTIHFFAVFQNFFFFLPQLEIFIIPYGNNVQSKCWRKRRGPVQKTGSQQSNSPVSKNCSLQLNKVVASSYSKRTPKIIIPVSGLSEVKVSTSQEGEPASNSKMMRQLTEQPHFLSYKTTTTSVVGKSSISQVGGGDWPSLPVGSIYPVARIDTSLISAGQSKKAERARLLKRKPLTQLKTPKEHRQTYQELYQGYFESNTIKPILEVSKSLQLSTLFWSL